MNAKMYKSTHYMNESEIIFSANRFFYDIRFSI